MSKKFIIEHLGDGVFKMTIREGWFKKMERACLNGSVLQEEYDAWQTMKTNRAIKLKIGDYEIFPSSMQDDKICIYHKSGEGGEFSRADFEAVISKFYTDNF